MKSSYAKNNYNLIFAELAKDSKFIVEFGILNGYSLKAFAESGNEVCAYDLFDDYAYNHPRYIDLVATFWKYDNVMILKGDFYKEHIHFKDNEIDLLHIDISNTGEVFRYAVEYWLPKVRGVMVLEGGSIERDKVDWMIKYKKEPINEYLKSSGLDYEIIEKYPSLTIIKK